MPIGDWRASDWFKTLQRKVTIYGEEPQAEIK